VGGCVAGGGSFILTPPTPRSCVSFLAVSSLLSVGLVVVWAEAAPAKQTKASAAKLRKILRIVGS
jgi:hypothetical protein